MAKIRWMILLVSTFLILVVPLALAFRTGGTDEAVLNQMYKCAFANIIVGFAAWSGTWTLKRWLGLYDRHLRAALYQGYAGKTLRCLVVVIGTVGIVLIATGVAVVGAGLLALLLGAGWTFARPLFAFGTLLFCSGVWPYAAARWTFPYSFPGRTL